MVNKAEVLDALANVEDPELGIGILDLGLVYRVEVSEERVEVDFTLTSEGCPLGEVLYRGIVRAVTEATAIQEVDARLVWKPHWQPDFMSDAARLELGYPV